MCAAGDGKPHRLRRCLCIATGPRLHHAGLHHAELPRHRRPRGYGATTPGRTRGTLSKMLTPIYDSEALLFLTGSTYLIGMHGCALVKKWDYLPTVRIFQRSSTPECSQFFKKKPSVHRCPGPGVKIVRTCSRLTEITETTDRLIATPTAYRDPAGIQDKVLPQNAWPSSAQDQAHSI